MKMDLEMEFHNAESSSSAANRKRKKWNRKSNVLCNNNDSGHDCPEGASLMQDTPLQENSCAQSTVNIRSNSVLIAESTVDINSGLIEAQPNSDLVCSENKTKRERQKKQKRHNAPATDNKESAVDISSNSGLIVESTVDNNSGLIEAQSDSDLVCSENKKKRKRQQKQKRHNAPTTDDTESTVDIRSNSGLIAESTVDVNSGLIEAQSNSDLVCSEDKKKRKGKQKHKRHNAPTTDNTESTVDIRSNSGLIEAHNNSSSMCSENKKKRKRQQLEKKPITDADLKEVTSKTTTASLETVALVDMITKAVSETAPLEVEAFGDTSTNMALAAEMNSSVDTSTMIHSVQNSRKKILKQGVRVLEHNSKDHVLPGDKSLNKNMLPDKVPSLQPSVDMYSKNELVVKRSNGDVCLFNGHNASENDRIVTLQMENGKNLEKEDTTKMDLAATPIEMNASVDTSTMIHSAQNLSRSQRKKLRKKLRKQGAHVLEQYAAKDRVLPGDNSPSKIMFPEKHLSFQPSVDICSKNELLVKRSNGVVSLFHGHSTSKNDSVINLQKEHGKNLEKVDAKKMDLVAAPVEMNASVDTSTMIHSAQNLSRSRRKKLRKKLRKQGAHVLEHAAAQDHVLLGDNSLSKSMFPEKHSSFQPAVEICSKNELVVKQSNGDLCLFYGHNASENSRAIDLQMANGKHLENKEAKPVPKVAELDSTTVREDFPISEKQSSCSNSANRSLMEKDDVHAESYPVSSKTSTRNIFTYKRKKILKTYIRTKRKKFSDSSVNSLDCIKEDGDSLMKNVSVLPEGQLELKERDKLDEIQISLQDASHGDGVSDEILAHPKEDNISGLDKSCKLPKEQHVEVETKRTETFPPSHLGVIKSDVLHAAGKEENHPQILQSPPERVCIGHSKKKLLVLDVNGLLADVVQSPCRRYKPDIMVSKKAVFKRPYCDEFLRFCFERFNVGVWSSRVKKNLDIVIDFLMGDSRKNLLFCWHASQCSKTGLDTIENNKKPLVLKELKKLWEKLEPNLPWEKGEYNETNTLLLDDSPYKALCNPAHTAIFPYPYDYRNDKDASLGSGGDLRVYLEGLADAENVQEYVWQNPFGQRAITERNPSWGFYSKVFLTKPRPPPYDDGDSKVTNAKS